MGTFPFGWIRGLDGDNWQILWSAEEQLLYAKGVQSNRILNIHATSTWEEAKALADKVQSSPDSFVKIENG
ncbi:MAG: hypothetical protein ACT4NX_06375 [Deltaproteobacteria bacterium]